MDYFKQVMSAEALKFLDLIMGRYQYKEIGGYVGSLRAPPRPRQASGRSSSPATP